MEAVGGKLFLYEDQLQFFSHGFNIQNKATVIPLAEIAEVGFYNTLGLIPNGLFVLKKDGFKERFVLSKRKVWKSAIEEQLTKI